MHTEIGVPFLTEGDAFREEEREVFSSLVFIVSPPLLLRTEALAVDLVVVLEGVVVLGKPLDVFLAESILHCFVDYNEKRL